MTRAHRALPALVAVLLAGCGDAADEPKTMASSSPEQEAATAQPTASTPATTTAKAPAPARSAASSVRTLATGLQVPWGLAFLPGGDALVAERTTGRILRVPKAGGTAKRVMTVPGVDTDAGEGGLLGLALSPGYAKDKLVYAYLTSRTDNRIVRFKLGGTPKAILTGIKRGFIHNGGRLAFGPDGKLYAGVGETGQTDLAQDRTKLNGKILRINPDGSVPADNPFKGSPVYSYGHRNVQGLAWDKAGRLWATEFGQSTRDEVNLIQAGHNYGWPIVEGTASTQGGRFTNPKVTWATSDSSPSGAAIRGSTLYVGALAGRRVWRIKLSGTSAGKPQALFTGRFGRVRTVALAPDDSLWLTTSNRDGRGDPKAGDDRVVRYRP